MKKQAFSKKKFFKILNDDWEQTVRIYSDFGNHHSNTNQQLKTEEQLKIHCRIVKSSN